MKSKTKWGATLVGIGLLIGTIGGMVQGNIDTVTGITAIFSEVGGVLTVWGIRDWPLINKKIPNWAGLFSLGRIQKSKALKMLV